ncbi:hypothetical protein [Emticicia agri]|uniref:Uncharacterized protein n=1 Tax=Emticicia agri TaxID=2492393 RepID=A0A4Q5M4Y6_9BACT|nr:hypothetical protein [Emticicia agri]RYU96963.1 hypothetical protein EWM59_03370 [Emticicia agri]
MIEVFTTDVRTRMQADVLLKNLTNAFTGLKFNFDLADTEVSFPCVHSILRVEGAMIEAKDIKAVMNQAKFQCEVLEDKVC